MSVQQARLALKNGQKTEARTLLHQAIRQNPNDYQAWLLLGAAAPTPEKSLEYIQRAEMLEPYNPAVKKAIVWAENRLEKVQNAPPETVPDRGRHGSTWLIGLIVLLMLLAGGITAVFLAYTWSTNIQKASVSPRQIANARPTAIIALSATPPPTANPFPAAAANPHPQSKQIAANDANDAPRAAWTITPTPTNTPTPTPTLVPTFLAPQNSKPAMRPFGVKQDEAWIDVDLSSQTLNAYEGNELVFTTRISSGTAEFPTVTGMFRVWLRLESQTMNGALLGYDYYLENVPYVMYFFEDYALHGAYWHNNFGYPMSHGCVNLSPADARWLYNWSAYGTVVNVHH